MKDDLLNYYSKRAAEYEAIYDKPERQADLLKLQTEIKEYFTGVDVLEIACGTGYWTKFISENANSVLGVDFSEEVLEIARAKNLPANTKFQQADIYDLKWIDKTFHTAFGGFIWSHIPLQKSEAFLQSVHSVLKPGTKVFFTDNIYVEGSNTPISHTDEFGNTYQQRKLKDGSDYEVIKNFPSENFIYELLKDKVSDFEFHKLQYLWYLTYKIL